MDIEKTIQFLLEQQARFDAQQAEYAAQFAAHQAEYAARFSDHQGEFEARQAKFEEDISVINGIVLRVATSQQRTNEILEALTEKHLELAESHKVLSVAQRSTEQKLDAVISAVERHIANHT